MEPEKISESLVDTEIQNPVEELSDDLSELVDDSTLKPSNNPPTFDMTEEVEQMMKKVMRDILLSGNSDSETNPDFRKIVFTSVDEEPKKSVWVYPGKKHLNTPFIFFLIF